MIKRSDISGGILSGGEGSRLGGQDKGLIRCANLSFVEHVHATMQSNVAQVLLNANRNFADYRSLGFDPIVDKRDGFFGPLAGIETLLAHCPSEWLWTMPVDSVDQPSSLLAQLVEAQHATGSQRVAVKVNGRENPVCALLHRSQLESVAKALDDGQRSVIRWLGKDVKWVDFHQEENQWIWSVNTPQQLALAEQQLACLN